MLASRLMKRAPAPLQQGVRTLTTTNLTTSVSPTLLAQSRRRVDEINSKASDQVGDQLARRWLSAAGAAGSDTDRVGTLTL